MAVLNSRMNSQCGQLTLNRQPCTLFFHHTVILLLLTDIRTGQSETVTSSQKIITVVGEDVTLPCYLDPATDAVSKILEWGRPDLDPRFVHVWFEGQDHLVNQNPSYKGRTSLSTEKLKQGDLSLKLSKVKHSDNGRYRCFFPSESKESTIELLVGSLSLPTVAEVNINRSAVALQCESAGWYPEPELLWMDSDGNSHSAGPTEILRGPDDLYTVSSRVTVEKRHRNTVNCIVQQRDINQSRETQMHVSGDCVAVPPSSALRVSIILAVFLICTCTTIVVLWIWRQNKIKEKKRQTEDEAEEKEKEQLLAENKKSEELQQKEEELKDLEELVNILIEQENELKKVKNELKQQRDMVDGEVEDIENKLKSVDKNTESDRAKGYMDLKEIITESKNKLLKKKVANSELQANIENRLLRTQHIHDKMTQRKPEVEKQLAELQKQKDEIKKTLNLEQNQETLNV
ncbi:butyrophilin subfamily 1 member A1-like [Astatotilapia calliptera]|uniref:butyrophilin subfamily 1 member A1-like n=1 Tax=Astatotilapia calliptera TaxID=8154 RepID=UPI000E41BB6F|nr:butyrophilin subfamily 1 member A1-like [Astatotilapia calliptera]XP_026019176.1 butyrophilin subfamily 1 member A1-like [Astatotilapia calliptera]